MKRSFLIATLWAATGLATAQTEVNVNSRYVVERVDIAGSSKNQISRGLREDIENLVGRRLNQDTLGQLARRMQRELHARLVSSKLTRGTQPEHVIVLFEVKGQRPRDKFDLSLPKGVYHSRQGWSGVLSAKFSAGDSRFNLGILSDGDELTERYAGVKAGYEHDRVFTDRVRLGFQFASYHQQWSRQTLSALTAEPDVPGIYRTRQEFAPSVTLVLAEPLTLTAGTSFQRFQTQSPAAHTEASNAVTSTLRYARRLEDAHGNKHELEAGYSLRAATKTLDSDYAYARYRLDAGYVYRRGRQQIDLSFLAGHVSGSPPLFERFVLGNSSTLRGWSKFDVAPLGSTGVAHGSLGYSYRGCRVFYDAGALWNENQSGDTRHSLGVGYGAKGGFFLALAFPVKSGRAQPVFMAGVAY
ncbi:MAG: BamA/TamA family outer membrane protein [Bryobacteraceae bacterium]